MSRTSTTYGISTRDLSVFEGTRFQLAMQKMVINAVVEEKIDQTQRLATVVDGITRHSPEGMNFNARVEQVGW